ncbi:putative disease resistance protein At1g50180 [Andrographis paniculata]|uniref:putative disease resistance protein At1g50180 n=1 Tax=Andrographis paniculata TaxID=175694 RepID=UPI0021E9A2A7|nr:putative disease resistance protein At1g50180 [Andrographis paniculata]
MAEAAVSFAVEKLSDMAIQKVTFLLNVEDQLTRLKDQLENMQCFLRDAAEKQAAAADQLIGKWIADIRAVAHDSEDLIEIYALKVAAPRRRGLRGWLAWFPRHVYNLDRLGHAIEAIQRRLGAIEASRKAYGIENILKELGKGSISSSKSESVERRRKVSPWETERHVVGLEEHVQRLLAEVVWGGGEGLQVGGVVGMAGGGKSTLARMVYNHAAVAERYGRRRAWVCVTREFNPKEVMKAVVMQLVEKEEDRRTVADVMDKSPESEVQRMLQERLAGGGGYFLVVDDIWRQEDWDYLAKAFPDQGTSSRILVTSRFRNIPRGARYIHEHNGLDSDKSWELLLKVALIDKNKGKCPSELEAIGRQILDKCDGLPLAISVMGGLLQEQRQLKSGWEKVLKGMDSYLGRSDDSVMSILDLSYHDLPPQLKSCFLCLSFYKEDATIPARDLIQIWIAEGFTPSKKGGEETMENIARSYLDELINRNMIQVKDLGKDGVRVLNCQVHDLLHDLSIKKAKEEINFEALKEPFDLESFDKHRHCVVHYNNEGLVASKKNRRLRSLFFSGSKSEVNLDGVSSKFWESFEILRLLDLEGFGLKTFPNSICTMVALRYLRLRSNKLDKLPDTLGNLKRLQLLDVSDNHRLVVPNIIWQLESLRHLFMDGQIVCEEPLRLDTLKKLQTLSFVWTSNIVVEHLAELTSLCKLGLGLKEGVDANKLFASMAKLKNFVSIDVTFAEGAFASTDGLESLQHLIRLKIRFQVPKISSFENLLQNLSYVTLIQTELNEDPMPALEQLPNLVYLKLDQALHYENNAMVISRNGFSMLKEVHFLDLWYLENVEIGDGAMSELERLNIQFCPRLKILPEKEEMRLMRNLQELKMLWVSSENIAKLQDPKYSHVFSNIRSVEIDHTYDV